MGIRGIFARNLRRQVRHEKGYSQEALVLEAGVDRTYISPLDRCIYSASIDMTRSSQLSWASKLTRCSTALLQKPVGRSLCCPAPITARSLLKPAASASNKVHATVRWRVG
jgi:transcriptional regulator with XRE-family HTH domain